MILKHHWRLYALSMALPFIILLPAGFYWLWLNHLLLAWFLVSAVLALGVWSFSYLQKSQKKEPAWLDISDKVLKTAENELAWRNVEIISKKIRNSDPDLSDSNFYLLTLLEVMNSVAAVYFPQRKQAMLEIKIPYLLKVIEMLSQDLRINFTENVPGSHLFSLNDIIKGRKIANRSHKLYRLVRLVSAGFDPVSAAIRELKMFTTNTLFTETTQDMKSWLIDAYIKKIGFYAIELYSGHMPLDDEAVDRPTAKTRREIHKLDQREKIIKTEPFRILVAGQGNTGKASLINALADQQLALADVELNPLSQQTYLIRRNSYPATLIANTFRYDELHYQQQQKAFLALAASNDVIILLLSAANPLKQIDKSVWDDLKKMPVSARIVLAITHIDKLRPLREWNPPYDLTAASSAKAVAINQATALIAAELGFDKKLVVPVSFRPDVPFNFQEQLLPLLEEQCKLMENRRYLRGLYASQGELKKKRLWRQIYKAGHSVSKLGLDFLVKRKGVRIKRTLF